jgi:hypothetical protein
MFETTRKPAPNTENPAELESVFLQRIVSERLRHGLPRHFEPTRSRLDSRLSPL